MGSARSLRIQLPRVRRERRIFSFLDAPENGIDLWGSRGSVDCQVGNDKAGSLPRNKLQRRLYCVNKFAQNDESFGQIDRSGWWKRRIEWVLISRRNEKRLSIWQPPDANLNQTSVQESIGRNGEICKRGIQVYRLHAIPERISLPKFSGQGVASPCSYIRELKPT